MSSFAQSDGFFPISQADLPRTAHQRTSRSRGVNKWFLVPASAGPRSSPVALAPSDRELMSSCHATVARKLLGADKRIGMSIHTVTGAEAIDPCVVDYVIAGPAFETASKPGYGPEIGCKGLAEIAAAARVPVFAIGGINATRAAEVLVAGPVGIAVMGIVMRPADPRQDNESVALLLIRKNKKQ